MTSTKYSNKFRLVGICSALYLYEIIIGLVWSYNYKKILINNSPVENL